MLYVLVQRKLQYSLQKKMLANPFAPWTSLTTESMRVMGHVVFTVPEWVCRLSNVRPNIDGGFLGTIRGAEKNYLLEVYFNEPS